MADDLHTKQSQPWYAMSLKKKSDLHFWSGWHPWGSITWLWRGRSCRHMLLIYHMKWRSGETNASTLRIPLTWVTWDMQSTGIVHLHQHECIFWLESKWRTKQVRILGKWVRKPRKKSTKFSVLNPIFPLVYFLSIISVAVFWFSDRYFQGHNLSHMHWC